MLLRSSSRRSGDSIAEVTVETTGPTETWLGGSGVPGCWKMSERRKIEGVLFDSGDTLVRPIGGKWWPGPGFQRVLRAHGLRDFRWDWMGRALQAGMAYLDDNHNVMTEDDELDHFKEYNKVLLENLGIGSRADELVHDLAQALVDRSIEFEPFSDTARVIRRMNGKGLFLGIISDAWPSLERKYRLLGLRDLFGTFVISSQVGCMKPGRQIFQAAIDGMGLAPESIMYVDDELRYVEAGIALGLNGVMMVRYGEPPSCGVPWVRNLEEAEAMLA